MDIPDIKLDSTFSDQMKAEMKQRAELGTDIPDITLDSTTVQQIEKEVVSRAETELKKQKEFGALEGMNKDSELGQLEEYKAKLEQTQEELRQAAAKQALKERMTSQARKFISEHADKIQQVQSKMGELKKKYSYVPNSNDLSTAKKRSSLEGESLWKRLVIGGNFSVSKTNPFTVDLSPVLGYKINKLFEVGATGAYRATFGANRSGIYGSDDETYGYGIFANHMVFRNFFAQLEAERMLTTTGPAEQPERLEANLSHWYGQKV